MLRDFVYKVLTITISETGFVCMYSCICDTYVSTIPKKPRNITQSNEPVSRELLNKFSANSWSWIFFCIGMQLFSPCLYVDTLQKVSEKNFTCSHICFFCTRFTTKSFVLWKLWKLCKLVGNTSDLFSVTLSCFGSVILPTVTLWR